jgi:osmotically-inducible protein OsmY
VKIMSQSEEVQTKVLNALYWDLAVPPHRVKVEVENGWVTISGTVDRYYQRTCAESDARGVPGVLGVNNHIRLAPAQAGQGAAAH